MTQYRPLTHSEVVDAVFGMKAASLGRLRQDEIVNVPDGWCISLRGQTTEDLLERGDLEDIWQRLGGDQRPLIVRSSASVEDLPAGLFAGRFVSQRDIDSFPSLVDAVKRVEASANDVAVTDYLRAHNLAREAVEMSVLIQVQVPALFAGVTFTEAPPGFTQRFAMLIEMIDGPSASLLAGTENGAAYGVTYDQAGQGQFGFEHLAGPNYDTRTVTSLLPIVHDTCEKVANFFGTPQDVEWAWDGEKLWVLQSRGLVGPREPSDHGPGLELEGEVGAREPVLRSLVQSRNWGLKGAAQVYFQGKGMGAANACLLLPGVPLHKAKESINARETSVNGTVVRFSHRAAVGLPKRFVPHGEDVYQAFQQARRDNRWMGIVSDYVFVTNSFEAYVTPTTLLVEHVPGNWEPSNRLKPDLFKFTEDGTEVLLFANYRLANVEHPHVGSRPSSVTQRTPPVSVAVAQAWCRRFIEDFRGIARDLRRDLPLNVHFVADETGRWYYLNIRPTAVLETDESDRLSGNQYKPSRVHLISQEEDIRDWDRVADILVDCVADRGDEARIASVARRLVEAGVREVYCTFGLLSHPSIVLREFGLRVKPLYIEHEQSRLDLKWP